MLFSLLVGGVGLIIVYLFIYGLYYAIQRKVMLLIFNDGNMENRDVMGESLIIFN